MNETYHNLCHDIKRLICKHLAIPDDLDLEINNIHDSSIDLTMVIVKFKKIRYGGNYSQKVHLERMGGLYQAIDYIWS
jgi:hypothetical protein